MQGFIQDFDFREGELSSLVLMEEGVYHITARGV